MDNWFGGLKARGRLVALILLIMGVVATGILVWRWVRQPGTGGAGIPLSVSFSAGGPEMPQHLQSISFQLSEGEAQAQAGIPLSPPLATGEPLSEETLNNILGRLPELVSEPGLEVDFKIPPEPLPPPRPGVTIEEPFPPSAQLPLPEEPVAGPLQVLRHSPEGEIQVAPKIAVTFNQPMVPLGSLDALAADEVPVQVQPSLEGTWRWLGSKTLTFEYNSAEIDRLPKATVYRVSIPAGTRSATGSVLAEEYSWTFTTPPPKLTTWLPEDRPQPLEPIIYLHFDQRIHPEAVLQKVRVAANGQPVAIRMASAEEIEADAQAREAIKHAVEHRWLALRPLKALPRDAQVTVTVEAGTPSAEGPLTTTEEQSFSFRTYARLRVVNQFCSWGTNNQCLPLSPLVLRFNNPLDAEAYRDEMVRVEPAIPGAVVNLYEETLSIQGATRGRTSYTVYLSPDLKDVFGQRLGETPAYVFHIGAAEALLIGPQKPLVTIDPMAEKPIFSVYTINYTKLGVTIHAVEPSDWPAYGNYLNEWRRTDNPPAMPGRKVLDEIMSVEGTADSLTQVDIDLSRVMSGPYGHFVIEVRPPPEMFSHQEERYWHTIHAWVQVTQIGVDAFIDHSQMIVWTTRLKDGKPLADVELSTGEGNLLGKSAADGLARFSIPRGAYALVARMGADRAILPQNIYGWPGQGWQPMPPADELRWHVFDDRGMYRPGEEVHIKGWLRRIGGRQDGDVGLPGAGLEAVSYALNDSQGNNLLNGRASVNALGGFDFSFTLPERVNLGYAQLSLNAEGDLRGYGVTNWMHGVQIQEFRRPEFEVKTRSETNPPYFAGGSAVLAVEASYYAGGALPDAEVSWQVTSSPANYAPPGWSDYTFGTWKPWWRAGDFYASPYAWGGAGEAKTFSGRTGADGIHYLHVDFDTGAVNPSNLKAEATVIDVNRQAWSSSTSLLVHPASLYVGLRSQRYFVQKGQPLKIELIVTDLDGKPVADRSVELRAGRLVWKARGGAWQEEEVDVQRCQIGSALQPVSCTFETPLGGTYRITATVSDEQGRKNESQIIRWVTGGETPPTRLLEREEVTLIPDRESYQPGDTAEILVQSPFEAAEGLMTVSRSGILYSQRFQLRDYSATLHVPIEEGHIPNLNVQVDLAGATPRLDESGERVRGAPPRPAYASGVVTLEVPPESRRLNVEVMPEQRELEPGGETMLTVRVSGADGAPVPQAEVALVVVDESVLALSGYSFTDPLRVFYTPRSSLMESCYTRASLVLVEPRQLIGSGASAPRALENLQLMGVMESVPALATPVPAPSYAPGRVETVPGQAPIFMRADFNPLALFLPVSVTGADGTVRVKVKLPDNLTRYRVMAAVVEGGKRFGAGESSLTARLPLMVRPSLPRFLNFGDQFELPVVLQNQTDEAMVVDVAVRAANLRLGGEASDAADGQLSAAGQRVTVPARERVEVRFPAQTLLAGTTRIQVVAVSGDYADAATVELPVYTPATSEAFAVYGVVDEWAIAQPLLAPSGIFPQYGGLEVQTSSTALQALTDAVLYLVSYPYECTEQIASRVLGIAALRDVLAAFQAEGLPNAEELEASVQADIERLRGLQNEDGGFPYWRRGQESIPFNSIHVGLALQTAQAKGYTVPDELRSRLLDYLREIETHYPSYYGRRIRQTLSAYALYVRDRWGDGDAQKALKLLNEAGVEQASLEMLGWLWPVLQDAPGAENQLEAIRRRVQNSVVETAAAANFVTQYDDESYLILSSDRRTDAILLDALMSDEPQSDLIPKLVNGLMAHRQRGRWSNTQENVFVLLALDRYFNTYEAQTPDFVARLWLGEDYIAGHEFHGRTTERRETIVPMSYLLEKLAHAPSQPMLLSKEGVGRLYYRLGLRYAPLNLNMPPLDMGFVVQRRYEAVDDAQDVHREADGTWLIRAGARVRVRIQMVVESRRYHVALEDPLPAGLEIINPALNVSGGLPPETDASMRRPGWWWWTWYEHQNLRDQRAEAFATLLWDGVYEYSYIARATTPGRFIAPPAKAEEMYSPEVFGRSAGDVVIVR